MLRSLEVAKTGLEAQQTLLDVVSNNLANVSTSGYKKSRAVFQDLLYDIVRAPGAASSQTTLVPTGLQLGNGSVVVGTSRNFTQGTTVVTGNPFDLAISGPGFFQIQLPNGTTGYTRDGTFKLNADGALVTNDGYLVLPQLTVTGVTPDTVAIGRDGLATGLDFNGVVQQIGQVQIASFINPPGLRSLGGNLYAETTASGQAVTGNPGINGLGELTQKALENSNVNVAEELVNLITAQRAFEVASRAISSSDQILQKLGQL
ncbi:MAG: flagellar basal-body rod protein FlgG [Rhodocyclaceae bacterium]|nr:flagellar basal-body rod protein FlgG [Rhodocyclaceae bacterium]